MKQINTLAEFGQNVDRDSTIFIKVGGNFYPYAFRSLKISKVLEDILNNIIFS